MKNISIREHIKTNYLLGISAYIINIFEGLIVVLFPIVLSNSVDLVLNKDKVNINKLLLFFLIFFLVQIFVKYISKLITSRWILHIRTNLENNILYSMLDYEMTPAQVQIILNEKINILISKYYTVSLSIFILLAQFLFATGYGISLSLGTILFIVFMVIFSIIINIKFSDKLEEHTNMVQDSNVDVSEYIDGVFSSTKYLKIYNSLNYGKSVLVDSLNKRMNSLKTQKFYVVLVQTINIAISFFTQLGTMLIVLLLVYFKKISIGNAMGILFLLQYIIGPLNSFLTIKNNIDSTKSIQDEFNMLIKNNIDNKSSFLLDSISLKNLDFKYNDNQVLYDINLKFEKGKKYLILGHSGSGKSTLLNLLLNNFDTYTGDLLFNSEQGKSIDNKNLYPNFGYIDQSLNLLPVNIYENIALSKDYDEEIISNILIKLNLDYLDANRVVKDKNFSGGETQRILLARLIYHDVKWIFLDEVTSALDSYNSYNIEKLILSFEDKAVVNVTHKFNKDLVHLYDELIIINKGRVVYNDHPLLDSSEIDYYYKDKK